MIEFSGEKRGYPWHGLWKQTAGVDTGVITTEAGGEIILPEMQTPSDGDCFSVVIPGMPEVETTTDEATAGQAWLNYALLSGKDSLVYGKNIGRERHIYIDGQGRAWRVLVMLAGNRVESKITAYITAQRFGVVGVEVAEQSPAIELEVSYETTGTYTYGWSSADFPIRLDIDPRGAKILVGAPRTVGFGAIAEIVLSGSPADGNFSATMSLLWDEAEIDVWSGGGSGSYLYIWSPLEEVNGEWVRAGPYTSSEPPDLDGAPGSSVGLLAWKTSLASSRRHIAGARYSATGVPQLCIYEMDFDWSMTPNVGSGIPCSASQDVIEHVRIAVVCGPDTSEIRVTQTQEGTGTLYAGTGSGFSFSGFLTIDGMLTMAVSAERDSVYVATRDVLAGVLLEPPPHRLVGARISNSLYGAVSPGVIQHPEQPGDAVWDMDSAIVGPLLGRIGSTANPITVPNVVDGKPVFHASEQPVTGAVATSTEGIVCWV